jgi:hypothetical protein
MTAPTTIADFIAYLQTLPQDVEVQCLVTKGWSQTYTEWENINIQEHCNVIDFRSNNQFVKPESPNFNKVILEIGGK